MTATLPNPFAVAGRLTKAFTLAKFLRRAGISLEAAKTMQASEWELVARSAGTKPPSDETQRIALEKLAAMEQPTL
jgi:hypothetical protein